MAYHPETRALQSLNDQYGATQFPLYLNAAFSYENPEDIEKVFAGRKFGYIYGRIQNPTIMNVERKITDYAEARGTVLTATGMAALGGAILTLLSAGDSIIAHRAIFGGTIALFDRLFKKLGLGIVYVNFHDSNAIQEAIQASPSPALLFCESMGNPALDLLDIDRVGSIAREHALPLLVDATLTPPGFLSYSKGSVALEMHSSTKFICGNGTVLGGVIIDRGSYDWSRSPDATVQDFGRRFGKENAFLAAFRFQALQNLGMTQQPLAAALTGFSLESMSLRVEKQYKSAMELAEYLEDLLATDRYGEQYRVHYPGLESSSFYETAQKYMKRGAGGLLTIDLATKERAFAFGRALKLVRTMTNLGDARTLIVHPESTIFKDADEEQKKLAGVSPGLMRISLGLENINDLKADFTQALEIAAKEIQQ